MDLCALYRTLEKYNLPLVSNKYICTMELAKRIFKNDDSVQTYRLDVRSKKYGIELLHHYNALDDTKACSGGATWKYGNYGSKYEKACQLNEKEKVILIVKESDAIH